MRTIKIDIFNEKVLNILKELELLKLIRVRKERIDENDSSPFDWSIFKGAMSKQSMNEIDEQLNQLRNDWE